jgi:hypothetical protein
LRLAAARFKHSQLQNVSVALLTRLPPELLLSFQSALSFPSTSMPTRSHPCIKTLITDIESKQLNIRQTAKQILDLYPAIKSTYEGDKNWSSFWCSLRKEYLNKGWLDGNQGEPPPEPAQDSLPPARRGARTRSTPASTPKTPPSDESPLDDESPSILLSKMKMTSETETLTSTEQLPQTSEQSVFLQLGAEKWHDFNRNKHLSVLVHLPSGADTDNTDAHVHSGGKCLDIEWDSPDIFENPNFLQTYLQTNYNVDPSKFPFKIGSFREACRQRCMTGIKKRVSLVGQSSNLCCHIVLT